MKSHRVFVVIAAMLTLACLAAQSEAKTTFTLRSNAFAGGGTIPHESSYNGYGCTGKNISPELHWSGAPKNTQSFALTVFDPDANKGNGWWHWVVYGIDPATRSLAAGESSAGIEGKTDFGTRGYGGPCPPPGDAPHHFVFTLYAMDDALEGALDGPQVLAGMKGHVLAKARLVGRFGR